MTQTLLWDEGPGEVRAGLIENKALAEFRLIRPRVPEMALAAAGEIYTARIVAHLGNGRALASLGFGEDVLLQPAPKLPEGSLLAVEMTRAPIAEPGGWKRAIVRPSDAKASAQACWHFSGEPWELALRRLGPNVTTIICENKTAQTSLLDILGARAPSVRIDPAAIEDADFDTLIEQAVRGFFPIHHGELSIERTRAMTMIDIDGTGEPLLINTSAGTEIPRLLRLFDIGGSIGIDFLSMKSRAERTEIDAILGAACEKIGPHERTAINGFGFCQIIRPRTGPSIPEIMCETTPGHVSVESRAIALMRAAARSVGIGTRQLTAQPTVISFLKSRSHEIDALRHSLGTGIELVPDATATGYGHVHVRPL
jgi:ribonuclease G